MATIDVESDTTPEEEKAQLHVKIGRISKQIDRILDFMANDAE